MSLRDEYARAWQRKEGLNTGWIVNLDPTYPLGLGHVGVVDDNEFHYETDLAARGVGGLELRQPWGLDNTAWALQSNDEIRYSTGLAANTEGQLGAVGEAKIDVKVQFGRSAGVLMHGMAKWWDGFRDLGVLRAQIVQAARDGRLHAGESIVAERQLTGRGVAFIAQGQNASLDAEASASVAPGGLPPIGSLSGNISVAQASAGATLKSFPDGSVIAARVLYLGTRGWFWWREFEVFGAVEASPEEAEEIVMKPEEGDGDDQYFALVD